MHSTILQQNSGFTAQRSYSYRFAFSQLHMFPSPFAIEPTKVIFPPTYYERTVISTIRSPFYTIIYKTTIIFHPIQFHDLKPNGLN